MVPMHKAQDPHFVERVRASFARQPAMALIGASMPVVEAGYTEIHLPHKPDIAQQHGYIHGGVVGMIADSAAGYAASTLTAHETGVLTVEYKLNLLAPAEGQLLIAEGSVVRYGRTLIVTRAEVLAVKHGKKTLCALMQQTIMAVHGKKEKAPQDPLEERQTWNIRA
jgi:uncharacterized protein (TIGR00369 family)